MVVGVVFYGYIVASVAASLASADSGRARYQEKLKAIKAYLEVCALTVTYPAQPFWDGCIALQDQKVDIGIKRRVVK